MAIRIIENDFWATIKVHETLIRKCFIYIFNRYPDLSEGQESVYASMLVWLNEKDILNKFDHARTKEGKSEDTAWQHFVFCYIQKFLEGNYFNNVKHVLRNSPDENIDSYHRKSYSTLRKPDVTLYDEGTDKLFRDKNGSVKRQSRTTRINQAAVYPTIEDMDSLHSSKRYGFVEELEAEDLAVAIKKQLKNDLERKVFEGCAQGLSHRDIAVQVDRTPAAISAIVKRIKDRCVSCRVLV